MSGVARPLAGTSDEQRPVAAGAPGRAWAAQGPGETAGGASGGGAPAGERAPLTRARVLAAALNFVDREGVDALSMRKLGQQLGVEAMSLYNHVRSKDDLLAGVASLLLELVEVPDPATGDWQQRLRATADDVRRVGLAHPRAFPLLVSHQLSSLESWEPIVAAFALGQRAGLSSEDSMFAVTALSGFIVGFVLLEIGAHRLDAEGLRLGPADVPADRPLLCQYVTSRAATSFDRQFREGIGLVICGIEQRLGSARGR